MKDFTFNKIEYLNRIKCSGEIKPTFEHLSAIYHAQLFTIPFENFDISLNRTIYLAPGKLFQKLVQRKRGGYCFELNGLFLLALQSFGFNARALLGRVHFSGSPNGRGHQISLITLQGRQWIADVGFGRDTPRAPLPFIINQPTTHYGQTVRLVEDQCYGFMLQIKDDDKWDDLYSFDMEHVCPGDIEYGNYFTSTHPSSLFVCSRVAALPVGDGVVTLMDRTLKSTVEGKEIETQLEEGQAYIESLKTHFGIELDVPYKKLKPLEDNG